MVITEKIHIRNVIQTKQVAFMYLGIYIHTCVCELTHTRTYTYAYIHRYIYK